MVKQALVYADITNPQSLNKYNYTLNNPLRYIDPDGRSPQDSFHNRMDHLIRQQLKGEITEKQFREALRGPAVGAVGGAVVVLASRLGIVAAMALLRWASQNPQAANQFAQEIVQSSSGNPTPAKLTTEALGLAREAAVATIVGGKVARQKVLVEGLGRSEIDVIGKAGEYIAVGGPAKTASDVGRQLQILKAAAEQAGVKAVAYFAKGTPEEVLKVARRRLGAENVHIFEDVK